MRKVMVFLFLLSFTILRSLYAQEGQGEIAPDFSLKDLDGNTFRLADTAGKIVVLDFWATWCPPCQESVPHLVDLQEKYRSQGLEIVGVSLDRSGKRAVKPFAKRYKVNYKLLVGDYNQVVEDYGGIFGIPTLFIIDRKGKIAAKFIGYVEPEELEAEIKKLL